MSEINCSSACKVLQSTNTSTTFSAVNHLLFFLDQLLRNKVVLLKEVLPGDASSPVGDSQNQTCLLLQLSNQQNTQVCVNTSIEARIVKRKLDSKVELRTVEPRYFELAGGTKNCSK